jgi:hypothetical protein
VVIALVIVKNDSHERRISCHQLSRMSKGPDIRDSTALIQRSMLCSIPAQTTALNNIMTYADGVTYLDLADTVVKTIPASHECS